MDSFPIKFCKHLLDHVCRFQYVTMFLLAGTGSEGITFVLQDPVNPKALEVPKAMGRWREYFLRIPGLV